MSPTQTSELKFKVVSGGAEVKCGAALSLGQPASPFRLKDLRFFITDVTFFDEDREPTSFVLDERGPWQSRGAGLLDFEDGTAECAGGTAELNTRLTGSALGPVNAVRFTVGVRDAVNFAIDSAAQAPLKDSRLTRAGTDGHLFFRLEGQTSRGAWPLEVGSEGCDAGSCARPNRPLITLEEFSPTIDTVVLDLEVLLGASPLSTSDGCRATVADADCPAPFARLALPVPDGGVAPSAFRSR